MNKMTVKLNWLADMEESCTVKNVSFGWSVIRRFRPALDSCPQHFAQHPKNCNIFQIGPNWDCVFSAELVESVEITNSGAVITLRR